MQTYDCRVTYEKRIGSALVDSSYIYLQYPAHARHLNGTRINVLWCDGHATGVSCPVRSGSGREAAFDEFERAYLGELGFFSTVEANYWDRD